MIKKNFSLKTDKAVCKKVTEIVIGKKTIKKTVGSMIN